MNGLGDGQGVQRRQVVSVDGSRYRERAGGVRVDSLCITEIGVAKFEADPVVESITREGAPGVVATLARQRLRIAGLRVIAFAELAAHVGVRGMSLRGRQQDAQGKY